jgi:hypothetical protein
MANPRNKISGNQLYHIYPSGEDWVLMGHQNERASAREKRLTDIISKANNLLGHGDQAVAVIQWKKGTRDRLLVDRVYLNRTIEMDGRSASATNRYIQ